MTVTVPEFVQPTCPECAPGASDPHDEPDRPHVHLTPYGYLIYAPKHLHVDWLEELRAEAYGRGRDDEAAGLPCPGERGTPTTFRPAPDDGDRESW